MVWKRCAVWLWCSESLDDEGLWGTEMRMCSMWSLWFLPPVSSPAGLIYFCLLCTGTLTSWAFCRNLNICCEPFIGNLWRVCHRAKRETFICLTTDQTTSQQSAADQSKPLTLVCKRKNTVHDNKKGKSRSQLFSLFSLGHRSGHSADPFSILSLKTSLFHGAANVSTCTLALVLCTFLLLTQVFSAGLTFEISACLSNLVAESTGPHKHFPSGVFICARSPNASWGRLSLLLCFV